ncbi:CheR family methyltransferase [Ectobacillus ponti]|uniref:Protein-glutamate O-methyltransferase CheR n=1 Tax=Ectobacillus ponti TaxID=2961894 RepID=A0AA42BPK0_9BACI|nr:protein-glutamate O-methyltransferase CheR [Ectobacillus ponti]MCP8968832.1 protein-glutamate O-methyltransferase CheR [Ectobacillus ponti]
MTEHEYAAFTQQLKSRFHLDLSLYKQDRMKRRVEAFLVRRHFRDHTAFLKALADQSGLLDEFIEQLTINVSGFFRNKSKWDVLETKILPLLLAQNQGRLRIWSAACASGEEPYTLSIILSRLLPPSRFEILATDLDPGILQKAKCGIYDEHALTEAPEQVKQSCFVKQDGLYIMKEEFKRPVSFKRHDLLLQPYQGPYDLIVCRNVTIYFTEQAKAMIYEKFSKALRPGGVLFIGSTEQVIHPERFHLRMADTFFYQKQQNGQPMADRFL